MLTGSKGPRCSRPSVGVIPSTPSPATRAPPGPCSKSSLTCRPRGTKYRCRAALCATFWAILAAPLPSTRRGRPPRFLPSLRPPTSVLDALDELPWGDLCVPEFRVQFPASVVQQPEQFPLSDPLDA